MFGIKGDEATYVAMALSLAYDHDLTRTARPRPLRRHLSGGPGGNLSQARPSASDQVRHRAAVCPDLTTTGSANRSPVFRKGISLSGGCGAVRARPRDERLSRAACVAAVCRRHLRLPLSCHAVAAGGGAGVYARVHWRSRRAGVGRISDLRSVQLRAGLSRVFLLALQGSRAKGPAAGPGRPHAAAHRHLCGRPARGRHVFQVVERRADRAAPRPVSIAAPVHPRRGACRRLCGNRRRTLRAQRRHVRRLQLPGWRSKDLLHALSIRRAGRDLGTARAADDHQPRRSTGSARAHRSDRQVRRERQVLSCRPTFRLHPVFLSGSRGHRPVAAIRCPPRCLARGDLPHRPDVHRDAAAHLSVYLERGRGSAGKPVLPQPLSRAVLSRAPAVVSMAGDRRLGRRGVVHRQNARESIRGREVHLRDDRARLCAAAAGGAGHGERPADHARRAANAHLVLRRVVVFPRSARLHS